MNHIPSDAINEVKCTLCHSYLSYFPILSTEEEDVCGRCLIPEGKNALHNTAFEKIAQHIKFPCRFKEQGCVKELLPKDVPSHEEKCHFKIVKCPGKEFTGCSWQGACNSMLSHCRNTHKDMFLEDKSFELNLEDSSGNFHLQKFLEYNGSLFIVAIIHNLLSMYPKIVSFMIHHVKDEIINLENYSYQVVLSNDKLHLIVESATMSFSESEWYRINMDSLMKEDNNHIAGRIAFQRTVEDVIVSMQGPNEDMLSLLKCSKCQYYALPPIHQFEDNKIKCENCWTDETGLRNFTLDRIAEMLVYPCRFKKYGCDVVLNCKKMKEHMLNCPMKNVFCPICNLWNGLLKDFENHALETHSDMLVENDEELLINNLENTTMTRIIRHSDHIFQINCSVVKRVYKWQVLIVGYIKENNFQYEIEIKNVKGNNRVLMKRKSKWIDAKLNKGEEETFCKLVDNDMLQWKTVGKIGFKVRILKQ